MADRYPTTDWDYPVDEWEIAAEEDRPVELLGFTDESATGGAFVFDVHEETLYEAEPNEETGKVVPDTSSARKLGAEESLGEAIEDIGERLGWTGLSEFAAEHLEGEEGGEETNQSTSGRL